MAQRVQAVAAKLAPPAGTAIQALQQLVQQIDSAKVRLHATRRAAIWGGDRRPAGCALPCERRCQSAQPWFEGAPPGARSPVCRSCPRRLCFLLLLQPPLAEAEAARDAAIGALVASLAVNSPLAQGLELVSIASAVRACF